MKIKTNNKDLLSLFNKSIEAQQKKKEGKEKSRASIEATKHEQDHAKESKKIKIEKDKTGKLPEIKWKSRKQWEPLIGILKQMAQQVILS